jgi:hypothetical protein
MQIACGDLNGFHSHHRAVRKMIEFQGGLANFQEGSGIIQALEKYVNVKLDMHLTY